MLLINYPENKIKTVKIYGKLIFIIINFSKRPSDRHKIIIKVKKGKYVSHTFCLTAVYQNLVQTKILFPYIS